MKIITRLAQWLCWLMTRHETIIRSRLLEDASGRTYVHVRTECVRCGSTSAGWSYGDTYTGRKG